MPGEENLGVTIPLITAVSACGCCLITCIYGVACIYCSCFTAECVRDARKEAPNLREELTKCTSANKCIRVCVSETNECGEGILTCVIEAASDTVQCARGFFSDLWRDTKSCVTECCEDLVNSARNMVNGQ